MMLYGVSKAALNRMTHFFSEELREYGVAVNALSPGAVDTDTWNAHDAPAVADFKSKGLPAPARQRRLADRSSLLHSRLRRQ